MWLRKTASFMERWLSPLTTVVGNIGSGVIALMMLITVADVIGRRIFNQPIPGAMELSIFMMVIVVFFSIAYCEFRRGHIAIGLVVSRLRQSSQVIIDSLMYILFLATFGWLTWQLCLYAIDVWRNNTVSGVLEVPTFPFIFVAAFGCALLSLVVIMHLLIFLTRVASK